MCRFTLPDDAFTAYVKQQDTNGQDNPLLRTKIALEGGCDADLGDSTYVENINDAIAGGYITEDTLTTAVSRLSLDCFVSVFICAIWQKKTRILFVYLTFLFV